MGHFHACTKEYVTLHVLVTDGFEDWFQMEEGVLTQRKKLIGGPSHNTLTLVGILDTSRYISTMAIILEDIAEDSKVQQPAQLDFWRQHKDPHKQIHTPHS